MQAKNLLANDVSASDVYVTIDDMEYIQKLRPALEVYANIRKLAKAEGIIFGGCLGRYGFFPRYYSLLSNGNIERREKFVFQLYFSRHKRQLRPKLKEMLNADAKMINIDLIKAVIIEDITEGIGSLAKTKQCTQNNYFKFVQLVQEY